MEMYATALRQEAKAWQELEKALREQRLAIVKRENQRVYELQERLNELVQQALVAYHQTCQYREISQSGTPASGEEVRSAEAEVSRARQEARRALRLNQELLRDVCCYLQMVRDILRPRALPEHYGPKHLPRWEEPPEKSKVA